MEIIISLAHCSNPCLICLPCRLWLHTAMVTEFHALVRDVFAPRANKAAFEFASNALFDLGRGLGSAGAPLLPSI